jgi:hypothetical protein
MIDTKALAPAMRAGGRLSNFSISGKEMSTCEQRLRPEHEVDIGRARHDRLALLARHTAAHPDDEIRIRLLEVLHPPQIVEYPLLRLFAHRAGVEQDHVGLFRIVGLDQRFGFTEHVRHLVGVVLVHLAAECANIELLHYEP